MNKMQKNDLWLYKCGFKRGNEKFTMKTSRGVAEKVPIENIKTNVPTTTLSPDATQNPVNSSESDQTPEGDILRPTRRSTRVSKPPNRLTYLSLKSLLLSEETLVCEAATADPDTFYLHEARREKDWPKFQEAMQIEVDGQMRNKNFKLRLRSSLPAGTQVLPGVWVLKRKRRLLTGQIYKWKARLNLDGSRQIKGVHFDLTYAPVASWSVIRMLLVLVLAWKWISKQIDFVQAFTQAPTERPMFMEVPKGYTIKNGDPKDYVLEILANTYGAKQAPKVWYDYLTSKLLQAGWEKSKIDPNIFYNNLLKLILVCYVDDTIMLGPNSDNIMQAVSQLKKLKLDLTMEGDISDFLGVHIEKLPNGSFHLNQKHQIDRVLKDLSLTDENVKVKAVPCKVSKILKRDENGEDHDESFHYRSVIGKLSHIDRCTRLDISYIVHQCARFSSSPKQLHNKAIKWLGRYLKHTRKLGYIIQPDFEKGLEIFVDSDWAGNWDITNAHKDPDTAKSRYGFIIMFAGVPIFHASRLMQMITLSSTEAEYVGLSESLREAIPLINLVKELKQRGFSMPKSQTKVLCKLFEDNSGAIEIAKEEKYRPQTKHINVKYHHFRSLVQEGVISILPIKSEDNPADILTHPVTVERLAKHITTLLKWHLLPQLSKGVLQYLKSNDVGTH